MGNCNSQHLQQHIRVKEDGPYTPRKGGFRLHRKKRSYDDFDERIILKVQETTPGINSSATAVTDGTSTVGTMPLSPEENSLLSFISASSPRPLKIRTDISNGADQPLCSPEKNLSVSTGQRHHPSRALQQRLQKARYMQMVMSSPTPKLDKASLGGIDHTPSSSKNTTDYGPSRKISLSTSFLPKHGSEGEESSSKDITKDAVNSNLDNDDFEVALQKGVIWAELQASSPVLALALSRQEPTLECPSPPVLLAVGTESGELTIAELDDYGTGPRLGTLQKHQMNWKGRIRALDFMPGDGNYLAVAGDEGICTILGLDIAKGLSSQTKINQLAEIDREDRIYACSFSPDGHLIAIGGYDATVAILDLTCLTAPRLVARVPVNALVSTLHWSPDGHFIAIGGSDKIVTIVSVKEKYEVLCEIRRPTAITAIEWHPTLSGGGNRYHLAVGSNNVILLDREYFSIRKEISFDPPPCQEDLMMSSQSSICSNTSSSNSHSNAVRIQGLRWSPVDGNYLVVCDNFSRVKLLETKSFSTIQEFRHDSNIHCLEWGQKVSVSCGNQHFLSLGAQDGKVAILQAGPMELQGDKLNEADRTAASHKQWMLNDLAFGDAEDAIAETKMDHSFNSMEWVFNENGFGSPGSGDDGGDVLLSNENVFIERNQTGCIQALAFSRGSKSRPSAFLATSSQDGLVTVRSVGGSWKKLCQMEFLDPITCIAFSNGSRLMACGSNDGKVRIIETAPTWTVVSEIEAESPIMGLNFSKNNERLAITGNDGILTLVDPEENFDCVLNLEQESIISAVDWSSKHLAAGQDDGIVCIYDTGDLFSERAQVKTQLTRPCGVRTLAFGCGRFLVVGGVDGVLGVYSSAGEWALVHRISLDYGIESLKWSPSSRHLAVGNSNQLNIVDTIFWAHVQEVQKKYTPLHSDGKDALNDSSSDERSSSCRKKHSTMSFSQDGKFLAFADQTNGAFKVMNTLSWDVVYAFASHR